MSNYIPPYPVPLPADGFVTFDDIAGIQSSVDAMNSDINSININIDNLNLAADDLNTRTSSVETNYTTLNTTVQSHSTDILNLQNYRRSPKGVQVLASF